MQDLRWAVSFIRHGFQTVTPLIKPALLAVDKFARAALGYCASTFLEVRSFAQTPLL